ncbi:SpoIIE family protein phosphatase [Oleidesulfovibrio sp.]|uniref:SpoIIE family protein phosphatase n=1 Tax=Oleidesulfovibrio sp. TaxID=2909707 RepID=UPI003A85ADC7
MNIRWKFFSVLLASSVLPLLVVSMLIAVLGDNIERDVIRETRAELSDRASGAMLNMARNYASGLMQDIQALSVIAHTLQREAERLAVSPPPEEATALFSEDVHPQLPYPPDMELDEAYSGRPGGMMMTAATGYVSFGSMVFHVPSGSPTEKQREEAKRFLPLLSIMRDVRGIFGSYIYRMYIGLENGMTGMYPGTPDIPARYDPRIRPWYRAAAIRDSITWTSPVVDMITGRLTLNLSIPLHAEDGTLLGVAALDILMQQGLQAHSVVSHWSDDLDMLLVLKEPDEKGLPLLRVVGRTLRDNEGKQMWRMMTRDSGIPIPRGEPLDTLRAKMSKKSDGVMDLVFQGEPSLLAYAPITDDLSVIIITPRSVIEEVPDTISKMLTESDEAMNLVVGISLLTVLLGAFILSLLASRATTKPLMDIVNAARRLSQGDWTAHIPVRLGDERDEVINAFNEMGPRLSKQIQIQQALDVAHEIQTSLLPSAAPPFTGWDISGRSSYCDETGGDYYDYILTEGAGGPSLTVVLGDVSGHGLPSALLMATGRSLLRGQADSNQCLAHRIERANAILSEDVNGTGRFITLFALAISPASRVVQWVRAGHDPAIVYNAADGSFSQLQGSGLPLGVVPDAQYSAEEVELPEKSVVLLGTDGIWEAVNSQGEMFGKDRLYGIISTHANLCAHEISQAVIDAVNEFTRGATRLDDVTLVVLKPQAGSCGHAVTDEHDVPPESDDTIYVRLHSTQDAPALNDVIDKMCERAKCSQRARFSFTLAIDELVTNVFEHGSEEGTERRVEVWMWLQGTVLRARLEDNGHPFNCTKAPPPELNVPLEKRKKPVGGMGIHLVKQFMDDFRYVREKNKNIILLGKQLAEDPQQKPQQKIEE